MLWQKKQLNNQRDHILIKHLLSELELEELDRLAKLNDTFQEKWEDVSDSLIETFNVLVNEPPLTADNLPTDIQTFRQKIIDYLSTEQDQRSWLRKLRYKTVKKYWHKQSCF